MSSLSDASKDLKPEFEVPADIARHIPAGVWQPLLESKPQFGWIVQDDTGGGVWVRREDAGWFTGPTSVTDEAARLQWAGEHLADSAIGVPEVIEVMAGEDGMPGMIVTTLPYGESDLRLLPSGDDPLRIMAETLRAAHDLDISSSSCPFSVQPETLVEHVAARAESGLIQVAHLHDAYRRSTPESLMTHLRSMSPGPVDPTEQVFVQGCIGAHTLRVDPARAELTGTLAWSWSGIGDRHFDLAVAARSVMNTFGADAVGGLFDRYGFDAVDPLRLEFYGLVDELR